MPDENDGFIDDENINTYNEKINGFYGELGSDDSNQVVFLQTAITPNELDKISLIGDIPGSRKWSVRDLFQRDVDVKRVEDGLIPYFKDEKKVKFFNPITLTMLMMEGNEIIRDLPPMTIRSNVKDGNSAWKYNIVEAKDFFRFKIPVNRNGDPSYYQSALEWNNRKVKIVAIDGQHRLTALKLYAEDNPRQDFEKWSIPSVLFSVKQGATTNTTLLDIIRSIFVYINTEAKTPSRARQILLSDESINCICTQEILEYSHQNDVSDETDSEKMPLLFYDWRGEQKGSNDVAAPAAIKNIVEIHDWLKFYILGEDFEPEQQEALDIDAGDELADIFSGKKKISHEAVQSIRDRFNSDARDGLMNLLQNFTPYKNYIHFLRELENELSSASHKHAFDNLKFGTAGSSRAMNASIAEAQEEILERIRNFKLKRVNMPELLMLDIGMRAVIFAYSRLRIFYSEIKNEEVSWSDYSPWFTAALNSAYEDGWLQNRLEPLIEHISYDNNENTINYQLDKVDSALGAFLVILLSRYATKDNQDLIGKWQQLYDSYEPDIRSKLTTGYRKVQRINLKDEYPDRGQPFVNAVNAAAEIDVQDHFERLNRHLLNV